MFADLTSLVGSIFAVLTQIFNLYTGVGLLGGVLALWLIRRVVKVFRHL